jgi:ATP-dependent Clp protease ATP-binding subunit ClpA
LKRLIQREIADKAALLILEGSVGEDGAVRVDAPEGVLEVQAV